MRQKQLFSTIFLLLVIFLMVLPFLITFNEALTKIVEKFQLYTFIQNQIVPVQVQMVTILLTPFKINMLSHTRGFIVDGTYLGMTWNCIGWQSLLLLSITLFVGLKNGSYTLVSKVETILIGLLGIFIVNLLRLSLIIIIFAYLRPIYAIVYHDYLAAVITIIYLFIFWWFAYRFVLEEMPPAVTKNRDVNDRLL